MKPSFYQRLKTEDKFNRGVSRIFMFSFIALVLLLQFTISDIRVFYGVFVVYYGVTLFLNYFIFLPSLGKSIAFTLLTLVVALTLVVFLENAGFLNTFSFIGIVIIVPLIFIKALKISRPLE